MSPPEFVSRHIDRADDLDSFRSGRTELDQWLRQSAHHAEAIRSGRTWVWSRNGIVVAYFTLAGHVLERGGIPAKLGRGSPDRIPAVLIAKLALSEELHGHGLGGVLLADASHRILAATDVVAARFVVVDAIDDQAAAFYEHFGYRRIPGEARLVRKVSDLAADFGRRQDTYSFGAQRSALTSIVAGQHSAQSGIARNEQVVGSSPTSGSNPAR